MPRHETIEANLLDIFSKHKKFFDELALAEQMDLYKNAFIALHDKGYDIKHFEECFESLRQASQEASMHLLKYGSKTEEVNQLILTQEKFIGGEVELREELNKRLKPKSIGRATLYNYLEELGIRKSIYTDKDLNMVLELKQNRRTVRNKD